MTERKKPKGKRKYVLKSRAKVLLTLLILGYFAFIMVQQEFELRNQQVVMDDLQGNISKEQNENEMIRRQIRYTQTDDYIEEAARSRLGWVKDGEIIFIPNND
ncbi:MAG TPA: septum formation initiator family protein [Bacillota bacterium]|nr:septum formation initiator family protein [Bacillota bacterium]